jgi:GNAT superfamily N-acetyltransferase
MTDASIPPGGDAPGLNLAGYTDLPRGKIASIVTFLSMSAPPPPKADPPHCDSLRLEPLRGAQVTRYRTIFRVLGERWMWSSRLRLPVGNLAAQLDDPANAAFALADAGGDVGLLELDFREAGRCEIVFFGVYDRATGTGAARWLMNRALKLAWRQGVREVWLHTCNFDHPAAPDFYRRSGFKPYRLAIEVEDDPRLQGVLRRDCAPHVPLLPP